MSGTPVENRLMEFWTIMDFANRGFFPSPTEFREKYETPIQKNGDKEAAETFKKITAPFMLRRLKTDKNIIADLPDKIIQDEYAELTATQAALYQRTLDHFLAQIEEEKQLAEISQDSHGLFKRKGLILQMILALKQICNHPATFLKTGTTASQDNADPDRHPEHDSAKDPGPNLSSGKLQMLLDLLTSIQEQGEKTLIFTQFAEMGFLLQSTIEQELGLTAHFYHGGCSQTQRKNMVDDFQNNPDCKVLILSLKAGGTGLNLTAASQVIHYDLWWNPAIEAQATDRAFRIGQTRNVQVHRFITKGTFEEKINALLESKKAIADMTVSAGETWLTDLDDKALGEVFRLDNPAD
jgi:SNF2 family DNA or RNA helicase